MTSPRPGSLRGKSGHFNLLRVPNFLLEPRGSYLGERIGSVDTLNKLRSVAAIVIIVGMAVYYSGLSHLTTTTVDSHGTRVETVTANSPEGNWIVGVIVSVSLALFLLPVVSLAIVLWTRSGFRRATLYQLRWPVVSIAAFIGLFAAMTPILGAVRYLTSTATRHLNVVAKAAGGVVTFCVALVLLVWLVKGLYFAATGLFRADDGHPLLAPLAAPLVAITSAFMMETAGGNGLTGVPSAIGTITEFGGPVSITFLSVVTVLILRRRYRHDFPFRRGPLHRAPAEPPEEPAHAAAP